MCTLNVTLAPTLPCEKALSMDLYAENLISGFHSLNSPPNWNVALPSKSTNCSKTARYFLRNMAQPLWVRTVGRHRILHILDHSNGHLCRHHPKSIVTCHDIAEYRETALNSRQLAHWKWRVSGMKEAVRIIAISNNTKADLIEFLEIPENRIDVAYYGVDPLFRPWNRQDALKHIPELGGHEFKILHIGSNIQRKNVPVLIRALGLLKQRGVDFSWVKVGADFDSDHLEMIRETGISENIIFLGSKKTEELPLIYSLCDAFVFPSTYEGFGRPILEAQQCGTPVVLAESSCLPEIGGKGALYFPSHNEEALVSQLLSLQDHTTRASLILAGYENASRFNWKTHAEDVLRSYHLALES